MKCILGVVEWQAGLVSRNPLAGVIFLIVTTIAVVFWLPVKLHNLLGFSIAGSVTVLFFVQSANLFLVFRRLEF